MKTNLIFQTAISVLAISNRNSFRVPFYKISSVYYISEILEMASPDNQHCANCIGTLSFSMHGSPGYDWRFCRATLP